jgi:hypothetical protein
VGARLSAPVQTGPGAQTTAYTMGTESFPGVKRPGRGVGHPPLSKAEVKERVELYLYSPSGPSWPVLGLTLSCLYIYCVLKVVFFLACANAVSLLTDCLKIKCFEDCQNASKNFSRHLSWNPAVLGTVSLLV